MSADSEQISRVNYFNGQRLEASDFRAEQEYQIAVRRKLWSSLFSVGIVKGLEVTPHPTDPHKVLVAPGVALDFLGREIILVDSVEVIAAGTPTTNPAAIFGNYLVISYAEQRAQPNSDGCTTSGACGSNLSWGAATRIVAQPVLQFTDTFPSPISGQIVLAQVALETGCQVGQIQSGIRQYAVAAKPPTTRPVSIEGEKDIDSNNPKTLYFHIDSGVPNSVTLYLRATQFSTLYYSELGTHSHDNTLTQPNLSVPDHKHGFESIETDTATQDPSNPVHLVAWTYDDTTDTAVRMWGPQQNDSGRRQETLTDLNPFGDGNLIELQNLSAHTHDIGAGTTDSAGGGSYTLGLSLTIAETGVMPPGATLDASALSYVSGLTVLYDGQDITQSILTQLGNNYGQWSGITQLGDGSSTSPLVAQGDGSGGTGAISLDQLGLDFSPGQHTLKFQVPSGSGGQIQYNLYVQ